MTGAKGVALLMKSRRTITQPSCVAGICEAVSFELSQPMSTGWRLPLDECYAGLPRSMYVLPRKSTMDFDDLYEPRKTSLIGNTALDRGERI